MEMGYTRLLREMQPYSRPSRQKEGHAIYHSAANVREYTPSLSAIYIN